MILVLSDERSMNKVPQINSGDIVFIFIDLQEKLLGAIPNAKKILSHNELLLDTANLFHVPLFATTQYAKGLGEIVPELEKKLPAKPMDKTTFSCGLDFNIAQHLKNLGRQSVILSGVETHICVFQTAADLIRMGFQVTVVADAVGARHDLDHDIGLKRMEQSGALLVTTEMLVYELLQRSDHTAFKHLLPSIKKLDS
jgi:nicotinamidase-related amidase